jgi:hypothetical protein
MIKSVIFIQLRVICYDCYVRLYNGHYIQILISSHILAKIFLLRLKVHKIENFFDSDFEFCVISLLVMGYAQILRFCKKQIQLFRVV